jgi:hypothetical protein
MDRGLGMGRGFTVVVFGIFETLASKISQQDRDGQQKHSLLVGNGNNYFEGFDSK